MAQPSAATLRSALPRRRALVVHAHPDPASYSATLRDKAVVGLIRGGWHVNVTDLYAEGFAPAMSPAERGAYHGPDPVIDAHVARQAELVTAARALVFVYPTWWWGLPAVLEGWLERVLVPGVGFRFDARGRVRPGLTQVRRLVGISTYGSTHLRTAVFNDAGRRTLLRAVRLNTSWRCRSTWLGLYGMDRIDAEQRTAFAQRVESTLAGL
jgi:NAD(P)H dehydrogenase (quinone)